MFARVMRLRQRRSAGIGPNIDSRRSEASRASGSGVVRFESRRAVSIAFARTLVVVGLGALAAACKSKDSEPTASASAAAIAVDSGTAIGIEPCDQYLVKVEGCIARDPTKKEERQASLEKLTSKWRRASATNGTAVRFSCQQALDHLDVTMPGCK